MESVMHAPYMQPGMQTSPGMQSNAGRLQQQHLMFFMMPVKMMPSSNGHGGGWAPQMLPGQVTAAHSGWANASSSVQAENSEDQCHSYWGQPAGAAGAATPANAAAAGGSAPARELNPAASEFNPSSGAALPARESASRGTAREFNLAAKEFSPSAAEFNPSAKPFVPSLNQKAFEAQQPLRLSKAQQPQQPQVQRPQRAQRQTQQTTSQASQGLPELPVQPQAQGQPPSWPAKKVVAQTVAPAATQRPRGGGVGAAEPAPAAAAPAPAAVSASMGMAATPSKEEVDAAKSEADLYVWSANTLAAEGNPKAASMSATAQQKVQAYEALKAMFEAGQKKMSFA